jgi:hypothetical protein
MARRAGQRERYTHAAARAEALEGKLSYLTVSIPAPVKGLIVTRDGERIGDAAWGTAVPVDGGPHVVEATAPGRRPWRRDVTIEPRSARTKLEIPELALAPEGAPGAVDATSSSSPPIQRTIGWVAAATGAVALGTGLVFGAIAKSQYDDAGAHCSAVDCDARGVALTSDARSSATVSTVLFVAGGVLATTGVVLVLTAPKRADAVGTRVGLSFSPTRYGAWATF